MRPERSRGSRVSLRMAAISRPRPLLSLFAICVALLPLVTAAPVQAASTGDLSALRQLALDLVNQARRENGRQPLTFSEPLNEAAQFHAEDMLKRGYYSHVSPEGHDVRDRYLARGGSKWTLVEENIASCSPCAEVPGPDRVKRLQQGWMHSPHHRENILRPGITHFGYGIVAGENGPLYAVQTFAGPGTPRGAGSSAATAELSPGSAAEAFASALNDHRQARSLDPLDVSPALTEAARAMLPDKGKAIDLQAGGGITAALPPEARHDWGSFFVMAGECGGCGSHPTEADISFFLGQWMGDPAYAKRLNGRGQAAIGFAMRAYGDGRKVAIAVLGKK